MITFVTTAYKETIESYMFISSLILQTNPNWRCIVYCDEPNEFIKNTIKHFDDDRVAYMENNVAKRYYGHYNRKFVLENMVDTDFVIQSSIQDYYLPNTTELILNVKDEFDFIMYDCIHNKLNYNILRSQTIKGKIDWSSFATRTSLAKQIGIKNPESSLADGEFVEEVNMVKNLRKCKINRILVVHN